MWGSGHLDPVANGMSHDAMRGLKRQNSGLSKHSRGS